MYVDIKISKIKVSRKRSWFIHVLLCLFWNYPPLYFMYFYVSRKPISWMKYNGGVHWQKGNNGFWNFPRPYLGEFLSIFSFCFSLRSTAIYLIVHYLWNLSGYNISSWEYQFPWPCFLFKQHYTLSCSTEVSWEIRKSIDDWRFHYWYDLCTLLCYLA